MECASSCSSDDWESELEECATAIIVIQKTYKKRVWVHDVNKKREKYGAFNTLIKELELDCNRSRYHMYFRMYKEQFDYLHELIKDRIEKKNTTYRKCIGSRERLAICLRYLTTGNSFRSIGFSFRVGFNTVRNIVLEVCEAIWQVLRPIVMPHPTEEFWKEVSLRYKYMWNFPNCIGAIDGKHINIRCPIAGGSAYYNYKGMNSIVLMALADANYKFISVDVGAYGRNSDGNIFANSKLGKLLESKELNVPEDTPLIENGEPLPYVIVGDEAFPLKPYLLRPYSRNRIAENDANKIFNYRLSRARRVVENAFGILTARWRVFGRYFEVQPKMVDAIVLACCCLHNMLCANNDFDPDLTSINKVSSGFTDTTPLRRNVAQRSFTIREKFKDYFNSPVGSVPWQEEIIQHGRNPCT